MSKGTPLFALRLPLETQHGLAKMATIYGAPNVRAFAREILEIAVCADVKKSEDFVTRLAEKAAAHTVAIMAAEVAKGAEKPAVKAKSKGRRHGRPTR